jgi:hypothetical protein
VYRMNYDDGHSMASVPWLAEAMAELRHAIGIDRRRTRAQVVQPPCTVGVVGRRKTCNLHFFFCARSLFARRGCGHAATQILMTRRTETHVHAHVERAPIMSFHS